MKNTLLCQLYKLVTVPREHTYNLRGGKQKSYSTVKKYSSMRVEAAVPFTRLISYNIK